MSEQVFLALTALPRFWDSESRLLFLSEGSQRFSLKAEWEKRAAGVVPDPWCGASALGAGYERVRSLSELALPVLGARLNALHGVHRGARYWRILLGPWLIGYVGAILDRYSRLRLALDRHPGLKTIGLSPDSFATPKDTFEFVNWLSDDLYNQQLFTRILTVLGVHFPTLGAGSSQSSLKVSPTPASRLRGLSRLLERWAPPGHRLILKDSSFPPKDELVLILKSFGALWRRGSARKPPPAVANNLTLRRSLEGLSLGEDDFGRLLSNLLPFDLPQCFVESFKWVEAGAAADYPTTPKAIFSANAWYYDEPFKHWAGASAESGTRLLGVPHGVYGSMLFMSLPSEEHELSIVDRYYTWGWDRPGMAKIRPMPAPKLMNPPRFRSDGSGAILFGLTSGSRFMSDFPFTPEHHSGYLRDQLSFARALSPEVRAALRVRPHFADNGWDVAARWRQEFPEIELTGWEMTFLDALSSSRLYVCDHSSTTYAESLAAGHPTLLFWDPAAPANILRPEAQDVYDGLRRAGILHDTPESAAAALNDIYRDVPSWWSQPARQLSVSRFCERYARTSPDSASMWFDELRSAAASD